MDGSDDNLVFASAIQYSDEAGSFLKGPVGLQQQLQQYRPPSVVDDRSLLSEDHQVILPAIQHTITENSSQDPSSTSSSSSSASASASISLLERIQQQKKQPTDTKFLPTPPPSYAFINTTSIPPSNLSISSLIGNTEPSSHLTFNHVGPAISTDMNTSFLHHDTPVFANESYGHSSMHLSNSSYYSSKHPYATATTTATTTTNAHMDYKDKMYHIMSQAGRVATTTGYQIYHNLSEFLQGQDRTNMNSNSTSSRRRTQEMDYQRQSLLMDPHDDKDLYDDQEQQGSGGNISDSLILDETVMNQRVNLHRKRQLQWQKLKLQQDGHGESGDARSWIQEMFECTRDLFMSAPKHVQIGTVTVAVFILWLLLS